MRSRSLLRVRPWPPGSPCRASRCNVAVHSRRTRRAGSRLTPADANLGVVASARSVHVTGVTVALGAGPGDAVALVMRGGRQAGRRVSFDANFRRKLASADDLIGMFHTLCVYADDVLLGWGEAGLIAGDTSGEFLAPVRFRTPSDVASSRWLLQCDEFVAKGCRKSVVDAGTWNWSIRVSVVLHTRSEFGA